MIFAPFHKLTKHSSTRDRPLRDTKLKVILMSSRQYCTFLVNDCHFAIEAADVAEVLRAGTLTRVPLASHSILGLLNLRGRIVPVIDLRRRFQFPEADPNRSRTNVVLSMQGEWCSLLVDELLDVVDIDDDRIEHPTAESPEPHLDAVVGIYADESKLVHMLEPQRILQSLVIHRPRGGIV